MFKLGYEGVYGLLGPFTEVFATLHNESGVDRRDVLRLTDQLRWLNALVIAGYPAVGMEWHSETTRSLGLSPRVSTGREES